MACQLSACSVQPNWVPWIFWLCSYKPYPKQPSSTTGPPFLKLFAKHKVQENLLVKTEVKKSERPSLLSVSSATKSPISFSNQPTFSLLTILNQYNSRSCSCPWWYLLQASNTAKLWLCWHHPLVTRQYFWSGSLGLCLLPIAVCCLSSLLSQVYLLTSLLVGQHIKVTVLVLEDAVLKDLLAYLSYFAY